MARWHLSWLVLLLVPLLRAQEISKMHFVRASGEATVSVKPDRAQINIGVTNQAANAAEAATENAKQSTKMQSAIEQTLGDGGQVKTSGYSIAPQYDYSNGHAPRLTAYQANNTVMVTVDDLSRLGKVMDAATANGANNLNGVEFTLKDSSVVRAQALSAAAINARKNAEAIAKALGLEVTGVLQAEPTETTPIRPVARAMQAQEFTAAKSLPTPVQAGDLDVHASVTVTLAVR